MQLNLSILILKKIDINLSAAHNNLYISHPEYYYFKIVILFIFTSISMNQKWFQPRNDIVWWSMIFCVSETPRKIVVVDWHWNNNNYCCKLSRSHLHVHLNVMIKLLNLDCEWSLSSAKNKRPDEVQASRNTWRTHDTLGELVLRVLHDACVSPLSHFLPKL